MGALGVHALEIDVHVEGEVLLLVGREGDGAVHVVEAAPELTGLRVLHAEERGGVHAVDRVVAGESDVLWPRRPTYFAKTSGTTSGAKYIPLTKESVPYHIT